MESEKLERIRHSAAHVLAMAVLRIYPDTKLGIGVTTEDGFYQDFEFSTPIQQSDFKRIENEMLNIVKEKHPFTQIFLPKEIAINTLFQRGQIYKTELLQETNEEEISFYRTGPDFIDLCRGPHVLNTEELTAFRLTNLSGAYWKGDDTRPQLQRITGVAFRTQEELNTYFERQEALGEIDFRKIGRNLNYFIVQNQQINYSETGYYIFSELMNSIKRNILQAGFEELYIPIVRENSAEKIQAIFELKNRSYRELPLNWFNIGMLVSAEPIDIADKKLSLVHQLSIHNISKEANYELEMRKHMNLLIRVFNDLKLNFEIKIFSPDTENDFIQLISSHLEKNLISHSQIIDKSRKQVSVILNATDNYGRSWEIAETVVVYPAKTKYTNKEGELIPTINLHTQIIIENLIAFLLENNQGMLPFAFSPNKCVIIPISDKYNDFTERIGRLLQGMGVEAIIDDRSEKMQAKIRDAEVKKIPLIFIAGEKELINQAVSVRIRGNNEVGMIKLDKIPNLLERINDSEDVFFQL